MSKPQPFLPLFFGDLLAATPMWNGAERSLYILLLAYQWSAGPLPADPKRLALMCQYDAKAFAALWKTVGTKFVPMGDGIGNARLEQHRARAQEISDKRANAGSKGAAIKHGKPLAIATETPDKNLANAKVLYSHPNQTIQIQDSEAKASGAPAPQQALEPEPPDSLDRALFVEGRKVFGQSSGGLLNRAIKAKGKPWLVQMIETCRQKDQEAARAYLSAAMTEREQRRDRFQTA